MTAPASTAAPARAGGGRRGRSPGMRRSSRDRSACAAVRRRGRRAARQRRRAHRRAGRRGRGRPLGLRRSPGTATSCGRRRPPTPRRRRTQADAGCSQRPDCALGDVEAAGDGERSEPGDTVQRRPRDGAPTEPAQVDPAATGRHLRPWQDPASRRRRRSLLARCSVRRRHGRTLQNQGIDVPDQPAAEPRTSRRGRT